MHWHWGNLPLAIGSSVTATIVAFLAVAKPLHQIVRTAAKCYRHVRELLGSFDARDGTVSLFWGVRVRVWRKQPSARAILQGAKKCRYPCCTSSSTPQFDLFPQFIHRTSRMALVATRSVVEADIDGLPAKNEMDLLDDVYGRMHHVWLIKYKNMSEADRRAELVKMLFTRLVRGRRRRRCQQRIATALSSHLASEKTNDIMTRRPSRRSAKRAHIAMYNVISDVIRRLPNKESLVFLVKVFAELPEEEIARLTRLKPYVVRAYSRKATELLQDRVTQEAVKDLELLALIREVSWREGVML